MKKNLLFILILLNLAGCASMINSATQRMADNLTAAMLNQNDPETVRTAAPAYLVMIDSLIEGDPDNVPMLLSGAKLYASYTSAFVDNEKRAKRLAGKSLDYAQRALCLKLESLCQALDKPLAEFEPVLKQVTISQQPLLYAFGSAWAGWIQVNTDDWNAVAQVPKLNAIFNHSITLDETYDYGGAHLYLGVLASQIPPSLGGKPEVGRYHFERAQYLSNNKNLMVNVMFAEHYARLVFNQDLHDELLQQTLSTDIQEPGMTLINTLAKQRAGQLLAESPDYF